MTTAARREAEQLLGRWAQVADDALAALGREDDAAVVAALASRDALCAELARALAAAMPATPSTHAAMEAARQADERLGAALVARRAALEGELAGVAQQAVAIDGYRPAEAPHSRLDITR